MAPSNNNGPKLVGLGLPQREPELADVLRVWLRQMLLNLNCAKIGQIETFDPATRTASVVVQGLRVLKSGATSPYPKLVNVPVFTLQGGGAAVQLPVAAGDDCIVVFSDRNIDAWYLNGNAQAPLDGRLHDLSDGLALVGVNFQASTTIPTPPTDEARMIWQAAKFGLKGGKLTVANQTQSLLAALTKLVQGIQGATAGGNPIVDATGKIAGALTDLNALLY